MIFNLNCFHCFFTDPFLRSSIVPFITAVAGDKAARAQSVSFPLNTCNLFSGKLSELYRDLVLHLSSKDDFILSTQNTDGMFSCVINMLIRGVH